MFSGHHSIDLPGPNLRFPRKTQHTTRPHLNFQKFVRLGYASLIKLDDVLTFSLGSRVRIIRIVSITDCRGSVKDALTLYNDMSPHSDSRDRNEEKVLEQGIRETGTGRPTKRQRRQIERLRDRARD